jgi:glycosyltransferase involved in cell wall biosynthesis
MNAPLTIAVFAGNSVGGTEKAALLFAMELVRRGHRILFVTPSGPATPCLLPVNVQRVDPPENALAWARWLADERVDVVHQHVPGYPMPTPIYEALQLMGKERPRLIETNVFGMLDDIEGRKWIDFYCFVSQASATQAFRRRGLPANEATLIDKTVVCNPLPPFVEDVVERRQAMRHELGLNANDVLVLRIGRASAKWNRDEVRVFQRARRQNNTLRLLLMEPPADIWHEVESGRWGEGILLHRVLTDFDRLVSIYTAGDVMLHMSAWGESFGYTIAEAMQAGMPLVTRTTPWGDNAQVELVDHGQTGFVCNSVEGAVKSLLLLASDSILRAEMGTAGKNRVAALSDLSRETDLLEEVLLHVARGESLYKVTERNGQLLAFCAMFPALERKVTELGQSGLRLAHAKGMFISTLRQIKTAIGACLRRMRLRAR